MKDLTKQNQPTSEKFSVRVSKLQCKGKLISLGDMKLFLLTLRILI